ncbi:MAG: DNA polymerase III subunit delta [Candidatus Latescibacterota bacterium]
MDSGRRRPFYLLHGEEDFEREGACAYLAGVLTPQQAPEFNADQFRGEDCSARAVLEAYQAYPVLADHRLVVLRGAEKLSAEACRGLEAVVDAPMSSTVLVVCGRSVDLRRRLFQQLRQQGLAVEFRPPFDNQVPAWIRAYGQRLDLRVEAEAADLLHACAGRNLGELAGELERLATQLGRGGVVTRQIVEQAMGPTRAVTVFQLTDAIGLGDRRRAALLLGEMLAQGEEPTRILGMVCRHFRLLLKAVALQRQGPLSVPEAAAHLGVAPFFASSYLSQARRHEAAGLWADLSALLEADLRLKSLGQRAEGSIMDLLLSRLCALVPGRPPRVDTGRPGRYIAAPTDVITH